MIDNSLIAIAARSTIEPNVVFLDTKTGRRFSSPDIPLSADISSLNTIGFSPRGSFFFTEQGVWRTADWVKVSDDTHIWTVAFSYDETYACVTTYYGGSSTCKMYEVSSWMVVATLAGKHGAAFSPDGATLAAYSGSYYDAAISFYSVPDGELIQQVALPSHPIGQASYTDYIRELRYSPSQPYIMFLTNKDRFGAYSLDDFSLIYLSDQNEGQGLDVNSSGTLIAVASGINRLVTILDGTTLTPVSGSMDEPAIYNRQNAVFVGDARYLLTHGFHGSESEFVYLRLFDTFSWGEIDSNFLDYASHVSKYMLSPAYIRHIAACDAPGIIKSVSGVVKDRYGQPCQRLVYVISRETPPVILDSALSDPVTGTYELRFLRTRDAIFVAVAGDYENGALVTPDVGFNLERPVCLTG